MYGESKIAHQIVPIGTSDDGEMFKISIQIPMKLGWIEHVKFSVMSRQETNIFELSHLKNQDGMAYFEAKICISTKALYRYYFSFEANGIYQLYKRINTTDNNSITYEECWKMSANFEVPKWVKGKIMYHIFIDRYRRGSKEMMQKMPRRTIHSSWNDQVVLGPDEDGNWNIDFFGGDLEGIKDTLRYIKKLGVSIIYLSPVCRSQSNHRYDTGNYEEVDPYAGCNEALKSLCEKAHELEMRVILDAVFNHTGNDSLYFNQYGTYDSIGAYQSEKSKYASFYFEPYWKDGVKKYPSWWDFSNLPRCNGNSPQWRSYIFGEGGIIDKWFSLGIDGIRLDVADELQDDFIEGIRIAVKRNKPDGFIIGEVWKNPMRMNRGYLESGKGMDSVMNYLLVDSLIRYFKYADVSKLESIIQEILIEYPADTIFALMNFTSTHDISRAIEIFACDDFQQYGEWSWNLLNDSLPWIRNHKLSTSQYKRGREIYKAYVFTLVFLPGILSIFYGDEVGLQGIGNLANRAPYPWNKRDKKLLKFFRDMGKVRKKEKFLETAELKVISIDGQKLIFERYDGQSRIIVVVNRTDTYVKCEIPKKYKAYDIVYSLNNSTDHELTPYGGIAVKVK